MRRHVHVQKLPKSSLSIRLPSVTEGLEIQAGLRATIISIKLFNLPLNFYNKWFPDTITGRKMPTLAI
jgi:hypothetical protein